jgi:hypothetical protein
MTHQIFYIWQILEKKWDYNGTVHQLFIDSKKAYNSVRRELLYNILTEFGILRKLVGLTQMGLTKPTVQCVLASINLTNFLFRMA